MKRSMPQAHTSTSSSRPKLHKSHNKGKITVQETVKLEFKNGEVMALIASPAEMVEILGPGFSLVEPDEGESFFKELCNEVEASLGITIENKPAGNPDRSAATNNPVVESQVEDCQPDEPHFIDFVPLYMEAEDTETSGGIAEVIPGATEEEKISTGIEEEKARTEIDEEKISTGIEEEKARTEIDEEKISTGIEEETARTEIDEEKISTEIDEEKVRTEIDEEKISTGIDEEKARTEIDEEKISTGIDEEKARTEIDEETISTGIDEEKARTEIDEEKISTGIDEEKARTEIIDEEKISTGIDEEKARTEIDEEKISTGIDEERARTEIDEEKISTGIDEEKARTEIDEEKISTGIDEEKTPMEIIEENTPAVIYGDTPVDGSGTEISNILHVEDILIGSEPLAKENIVPVIFDNVEPATVNLVKDKVSLVTVKHLRPAEEMNVEKNEEIVHFPSSNFSGDTTAEETHMEIKTDRPYIKSEIKTSKDGSMVVFRRTYKPEHVNLPVKQNSAVRPSLKVETKGRRNYRIAMRKEMTSDDPDMNELKKLMKDSYDIRRQLIEQEAPVKRILRDFPALKLPDLIRQEFCQLRKRGITVLIRNLRSTFRVIMRKEKKSQRLALESSLARLAWEEWERSENSPSHDPKRKGLKRNVCMVLFCVKEIGHFDQGTLYVHSSEKQNASDHIPDQSPFIVVTKGSLFGTNSSFDIYAERNKIVTTYSFFDSMLNVYMLYWVLWMKYQERTKPIFEAFDSLASSKRRK